MKTKKIEGFNYAISRSGIVINLETKKRLKPFKNRKNYPYWRVSLCKNGKRHNFYVQRLVAEYWLPDSHKIRTHEVNHKRRKATHKCNAANLEFVTRKQNMAHRWNK